MQLELDLEFPEAVEEFEWTEEDARLAHEDFMCDCLRDEAMERGQ